MNAALRAFVIRRAGNRCEYCRLHQDDFPIASFQIEHVIAKQHGGSDDEINLAWSCPRCNAFKGPNLSGLDPRDGTLVALFNPREHIWEEHFTMIGFEIVGLTPSGRATVVTLNMNETPRLELRAAIGRRFEQREETDESNA